MGAILAAWAALNRHDRDTIYQVWPALADALRDAERADDLAEELAATRARDLTDDNPDNLNAGEYPYDCPHRDTDGAPCGYPIGRTGICKWGHTTDR